MGAGGGRLHCQLDSSQQGDNTTVQYSSVQYSTVLADLLLGGDVLLAGPAPGDGLHVLDPRPLGGVLGHQHTPPHSGRAGLACIHPQPSVSYTLPLI